MDCPVCKNVKLVMADRQGIEIDYCPNCRGVWLDRGELDKIIERSLGAGGQAAPQPVQPDPYRAPPPPPPPQQHGWGHQGQPHQQPGYPQQGYPQHGGHGYPQHPYHKKKKREGFLGELFDFD